MITDGPNGWPHDHWPWLAFQAKAMVKRRRKISSWTLNKAKPRWYSVWKLAGVLLVEFTFYHQCRKPGQTVTSVTHTGNQEFCIYFILYRNKTKKLRRKKEKKKNWWIIGLKLIGRSAKIFHCNSLRLWLSCTLGSREIKVFLILRLPLCLARRLWTRKTGSKGNYLLLVLFVLLWRSPALSAKHET